VFGAGPVRLPRANSADALCEATLPHNGFYGDAIVNALTASLR
jgi:hypothetical protein